MKLTKFLLLFSAFVCANTLFAQTEDDEFLVYRAYIEKDVDDWQEVIDRRRQTPNPTAEYLEQTINFEYGFVAWMLSKLDTQRERAEKYLEYALEDLEQYEDMDDCLASRVHAYYSAFIAYDIKLHPMKAPFTGLKSVKYSKSAIEADSTDYFVFIQNGNVLYYMPKMFGGSRKKAIESYDRAWDIMQDDFDDEGRNNWMYLNLLLTIGDAYKGIKDYDNVRAMYDSVLLLAPDFDWVRYELYPNLPKE